MILQSEEESAIAIVAILSVFVLCPIAIAYARVIWKRASEPRSVKSGEGDQIQRRLDQIQNSMDAMAIEVERISEGQRFVTKLLSDKDRQALGASRSNLNG